MAPLPCSRERTWTLFHQWKPVKCLFSPGSGSPSRSQPCPRSMRSQRHAVLRYKLRHGGTTRLHLGIPLPAGELGAGDRRGHGGGKEGPQGFLHGVNPSSAEGSLLAERGRGTLRPREVVSAAPNEAPL